MTAFSFQDWSSMKADEQEAYPGISIDRNHNVNNHDRGYYWSGQTAASALSRHVEATLTGPDEVAARRMWVGLRNLHRRAVNSDRQVDRAMAPRQKDAHAALGAYNGDLNHEQLEQLSSVFDDVARLQKEAEILGIDPQRAATRFLDRAAARAVGYDVDDNRVEPELRPLVESAEGSQVISNMNQSVRQLGSLLQGLELDALDHVSQIGTDGAYTEERRDEHRRLEEVLRSIPLILEPIDVQPERNFSVRMETREEATAMETIVRWAGTHDEGMPNSRDIHRAFASWRDAGLATSPYSPERENSLAIVAGNTVQARENLAELIAGLDEHPQSKDAPIVVLTTQADNDFVRMLEQTGRAVIDVHAEADAAGVSLVVAKDNELSSLDMQPARRIELLNLTADQAADPIERSLAVNALIGRANGVAYIAGEKLAPAEAQAIHLAGTLRKLTIGMNADGSRMGFKELADLRTKAREVDAQADPQRYFTAGHSRPFKGISAVAFNSSRNFDAAVRKAKKDGDLGQDRDIIAEAYGSIPKNTTILTVESDKNALNKWLETNATDRPVLYAEATRKLSYAEIYSTSGEGQRRVARDSEMEIKIYDKPASERKYGVEEIPGPDGSRVTRRVCLDQPIPWGDVNASGTEIVDPRIRGALILVSGMAGDRALNSGAQSIKIAQEACTDRANSALVLHDFQTDYHSAHMIMLADKMGKKATVLDGRGVEHPLAQAREETKQYAQSHTEVLDIEVGKLAKTSAPHPSNRTVDVAVGDDLGQLALANLPGMDAARAIRFAHLSVTINEMRTDNSDEMRQLLKDNGMPAETRAVINDDKVWHAALSRALKDHETARQMGAELHLPTDVSHPVEQASGGAVKHSVYTMGAYDFEKLPLAAFIGSSKPFRQAGKPLTLSEAQRGEKTGRSEMVDPAQAVDRALIRRTIEEVTKNGYGIAVPLEEGVSRAVIEEAASVRDAKVVVFAPSNHQAASPALRAAVGRLFEQDRAAVVMPTSIAPNAAPDPRPGEERRPERYLENRAAMQDMIARSAKLGIVVATSDRDQALHIVRRMNDLEKPIAAMVPQDVVMAGSDLYSGNLRLLRGRGTAMIESLSQAQAPSAQAFAEITDDKSNTVLEDGVRRGTAGTFESARLSRSDMLRSGHHYHQFGWQSAARPISSAESIERFIEAAGLGEGVLGQYQELSAREIERKRLDREDRYAQVSEFVASEFGTTSGLHRNAIMKEAGIAAFDNFHDRSDDSHDAASRRDMGGMGAARHMSQAAMER